METPPIGELIRQRREMLGISQSRLASAAGISTAQVSRLESGERSDPSFEAIVRLAAALDASLDDLARPFRDDPGVDADTWKQVGFEQVEEIVPGRIYQTYAIGRCFRISIMRSIGRGSKIRWKSSIDELLAIPDPHSEQHDSMGEQIHVWTTPIGIPARYHDDTPTNALRDAMRWLADWAGFNEIGRARRDATEAEHMEPELRGVVESIDEALSDIEPATWRDRDRASWSNQQYDIFISRDGCGSNQYVMMSYFKDTYKHAKPVVRFPLNHTGALEGAARIRSLFQG